MALTFLSSGLFTVNSWNYWTENIFSKQWKCFLSRWKYISFFLFDFSYVTEWNFSTCKSFTNDKLWISLVCKPNSSLFSGFFSLNSFLLKILLIHEHTPGSHFFSTNKHLILFSVIVENRKIKKNFSSHEFLFFSSRNITKLKRKRNQWKCRLPRYLSAVY